MKDYSNYNDAELITLLREDSPVDVHIFNIIYLKHSSQLYGYYLYHSDTKVEAEELFQDTWIRFYNSVKSGKRLDKILPVLLTIARNLSKDNFRRKSVSIILRESARKLYCVKSQNMY